jgi:hypothetical protein
MQENQNFDHPDLPRVVKRWRGLPVTERSSREGSAPAGRPGRAHSGTPGRASVEDHGVIAGQRQELDVRRGPLLLLEKGERLSVPTSEH